MPQARSRMRLAVLAVAFFAIVGVVGSQGLFTAPPDAAPSGATVPMSVITDDAGGVIALVPVTISGEGPFPFVLDTGASTSAIDSALATELGLVAEGDPAPLSGVGGTTVAEPSSISDWSVGSVPLPSNSTVIVNLPSGGSGTGIAGLLGSDVLSQFGSITIDYSGGQLILPTDDSTESDTTIP